MPHVPLLLYADGMVNKEDRAELIIVISDRDSLSTYLFYKIYLMIIS
jgi:hypothetical protein